MEICHYTSLAALEKILTKEHLSFHATRYDSMNDPLDYLFARDIILPKIYESIKDVDNTVIDKELINEYPYIVSFSKKIDDTLMWRLYNAKVALIFDYKKVSEYASKNNMYFNECKYVDSASILTVFNDLYQKLPIKSDCLCHDAQIIFTQLKQTDFLVESEIRLYNYSQESFCVNYNPDNTDNHCDIINCETSNLAPKVSGVRDNDYVLYQEFMLPKDAITGIIVYEHDNNRFESIKRHLEIILSSRDYGKKVIDNIIKTNSIKLKTSKNK